MQLSVEWKILKSVATEMFKRWFNIVPKMIKETNNRTLEYIQLPHRFSTCVPVLTTSPLSHLFVSCPISRITRNHTPIMGCFVSFERPLALAVLLLSGLF